MLYYQLLGRAQNNKRKKHKLKKNKHLKKINQTKILCKRKLNKAHWIILP